MTTATTETAQKFRIDWPKVGLFYSEPHRAAIERWFTQLDDDSLSHAGFNHWHELNEQPLSLPFSQGHAIKAAIQEFRLPKVSHVAHGGEGPLGLIAMRANYKSGRVDVVMVDDGCALSPVACRVWEGGAM